MTVLQSYESTTPIDVMRDRICLYTGLPAGFFDATQEGRRGVPTKGLRGGWPEQGSVATL
jgi:hypothetical protein